MTIIVGIGYIYVPYDVFLQVWICVVEEMLHESSEEDGQGEENKYPGHKPCLKVAWCMSNVESVNEQGQHHKEDHQVEDYHERFAPSSPLIPA
jgi:hypothetical protein